MKLGQYPTPPQADTPLKRDFQALGARVYELAEWIVNVSPAGPWALDDLLYPIALKLVMDGHLDASFVGGDPPNEETMDPAFFITLRVAWIDAALRRAPRAERIDMLRALARLRDGGSA